jgi:fermentation-respiration switch protein FrsA (DUF1100 family)
MTTMSGNTTAHRRVVRIPTAGGEELEAWVYLPCGGPHPAVVMAHGLGAIKEGGLAPFAERFCSEGFAAIVFDYRHWGGSSGQPRDVVSLLREREDYSTVIDWTAANPSIDSRRIFVWGPSFAGMHVVELAISDARLAGAIAQCPLVDAMAGAGTISPLRALQFLGLALWDSVRSLFGCSPIYLPMAVGPGEWGLLASEDALDGKRFVEPKEPGKWHNRIAARSLLTYLLSRPVRRAAAIRCPILLIIADGDITVPSEPVLRLASMTPYAELHRVPGGHSDGLAGGVAHDQVLDLEVEFLKRYASDSRM